MGNCALCKIREADKKGSHIVPHFLLKRIDNVEGKTGRDQELGFKLSNSDSKAYFGRSVSPEKLEEIFGHIPENELKGYKSELVVDNFICIRCEKRLSDIESEYSRSLGNFDSSNFKGSADPKVAALFWISIIWRISATNSSGFKLSSIEESKLRRLLDHYINEGGVRPLFAMEFSYTLFRSPGYSDKYPTSLVCHPSHRQPYSFIIDEFVLFFYFKPSHRNGLKQLFYGLEKLKSFRSNSLEDGEYIGIIKEGILKDSLLQVSNHFALRYLSSLDLKLDILHRKLGQTGRMSPELKNKIREEILSDKKRIGEKYSQREQIASVLKVFQQEFGPFPE